MTASPHVGFALLALTLTLAAGAAEAKPVGGPVLTQILGACLDYRNPPLSADVVEQALTDLSGQGFSMSWDASPAPWTPDLLEEPGQLSYCREMSAKLVRHGLGSVFAFPWSRLLPVKPVADQTAWLGQTLNPTTGAFESEAESPQWNFGAAAAKTAFVARSRALFRAVGPFQMLVTDEQIMASPGGNSPHVNKMSTYWTSPTYSKESLGTIAAPGSFRHYLAAAGYPRAATARFPVTTVAVEASPSANMGLPAVPLTADNADRLEADNGWPNSTLWRHWYGWRTEVYAEWVDGVTTAAMTPGAAARTGRAAPSPRPITGMTRPWVWMLTRSPACGTWTTWWRGTTRGRTSRRSSARR